MVVSSLQSETDDSCGNIDHADRGADHARCFHSADRARCPHQQPPCRMRCTRARNIAGDHAAQLAVPILPRTCGIARCRGRPGCRYPCRPCGPGSTCVKEASHLGAVGASARLSGSRQPHPALSAARGWWAHVADYVQLTKPRLNLLVVVTSAVGFYLGAGGLLDPLGMAIASIGTALVAGGAAVLNQVSEKDTDALMERTRSRPLPAGRLTTGDAQRFGVLIAALGLALLAFGSNLLAALLALATLCIYLAVYTPLKRRSPAATLVGAIPGALPPLIGWTAGHGTASLGGWTLFAIVFLWQIPHFMAIAWMYRDDYSRAR